jgi:hypothetical protein
MYTYIYGYLYYFFLFIHFFFYYFRYFTFTQFSSRYSCFTVSVSSLRRLRAPPPCIVDNEKKCVGYNFEGGFKNDSLNHRDENGEEIPNIQEYFKKK